MEKAIIGPYLSNDMLVCDSVNQFLKPFENILDIDLNNDMHLEFDMYHESLNRKISPILTLARPDDAKVIVKIYKELYLGSYPYREMEDEKEVRTMIESTNHNFILFKDKIGNIAGCVTFVLDFGNKRGYIRGFMLRKKYQGKLDIVKAMMGSMIGMCTILKEKIFVWYVENRTAHSKSQYPMWLCGIKPIAFLPNKDIFFNNIESDLMQIIYDKKALREYRRKDIPLIIPEAFKCFHYSNIRYNLGHVKLSRPKLKLKSIETIKIKNKLHVRIKRDDFGYRRIKFFLENSDSYFKFLFSPTIQNFEKTEYKVSNIEELFVFVQEFKRFARRLNIRYYEVFVSAYEPYHQKIFLDAGLSPRGYIPSWSSTSDGYELEDNILFNYYKGNITSNIELIPEAKLLLKFLNEF